MEESRLLHWNAARARLEASRAFDDGISAGLNRLADDYDREARRLNLAELGAPLKLARR